MEFFKKLSQLSVTNIDIKIVSKNDKMTVSVLPKVDMKDMKPLVLTGTAEELDSGFFEIFEPTVEDLKGIISNRDNFLEEAKKKAKEAVEEKKDTPKKAAAKKDSAPKKEAKPAVEKPKPPYKFQKYLDKILEVVGQKDFELTMENMVDLKDRVDMLAIMDKDNEVAKEWTQKIKEFKINASQLFQGEESKPIVETPDPIAPFGPPAPEEDDEEDDLGGLDDMDDLEGIINQ